MGDSHFVTSPRRSRPVPLLSEWNPAARSFGPSHAGLNSFPVPPRPQPGLRLRTPFTIPISLNVVTNDSGGKPIVQASTTLPAMVHKSINLSNLFPALTSTFRGSVVVGTGGAGSVCGLELGIGCGCLIELSSVQPWLACFANMNESGKSGSNY